MGLGLHHYERLREGQVKIPDRHRKFMATDVEEQRKGPWQIKKFEVGTGLENLRLMREGRGCYPGTYTRLVHDRRGVVMSDTTAEIEDHLVAYRAAKGRCLIHGLGLGCLLRAILTKEQVEYVDVVELDSDVIDLMEPYFDDPRVKIHHDDCFTRKWPPNTHWDMVWHDIWDSMCEENLPQMRTLHRKFGRRCEWQGSWSRDYLEMRMR